MEKSGKPSSSPLVRLVKTKSLNILVAIVLIVCLILFMRGGDPDDRITVVEGKRGGTQNEAVNSHREAGQEGIPLDDETDYDDSMDKQMQADKDEEEEDIELTTTDAMISTTPYFTTAGVKVHLHKDGSKESVHIDLLRVSGFNMNTIKLDHLNNYRNPCFFEEREDTNVVIADSTYKKNPFLQKEPFSEHFTNLRKMVVRSHEELCGDSQGCRLRCLPYFMVLGVAERETVDFYEHLALHPQVHPPVVPEISFWHKYRFTDVNFNDYLDLYDNATTAIHKSVFTADDSGKQIYLDVSGEMAPIAMMADQLWMNDPRNEDLKEPFTLLAHDLQAVIPSLKFIMLLRDPVSHMYWHYNNAPYGKDKTPEEFHMRVNNSMTWWTQCLEKHPFRACVYGNPKDMEVFEDRSDNTWWPKSSRFLGALRDGLYWVYITDYLKVFPRDSFLILRSEDFVDSPKEVLTKHVIPFLDLSQPDHDLELQSASKNSNTTEQSQKPMLPETEKMLTKFYGQYNKKLAELLEDDKFLWEDTRSRSYKSNN